MATETKHVGVSRLHAEDRDKTASQSEVLEFASETREAGSGEHEHSIARRDLYRIVFVAVAAGSLWFLKAVPTPFYVGIGVLCAAVGGYPIFREAIENILERRMTMED